MIADCDNRYGGRVRDRTLIVCYNDLDSTSSAWKGSVLYPAYPDNRPMTSMHTIDTVVPEDESKPRGEAHKEYFALHDFNYSPATKSETNLLALLDTGVE